jgi:predicted lipid-binding transport protein (Tim44 family)
MKPALHVAPIAAVRWCLRARPGVIGVALLGTMFGVGEVCAAALPGSLTSSAGLLTALVMWLVIKTLPTPGMSDAVLLTGAMAACGAGAAWFWRRRSNLSLGLDASGGAASARLLSTFAPGSTPARSSRAATAAAAAVALPAELAPASLLRDLRSHFVRLQAAWDAGEVDALRALVTTRMLDQLCESRPACDAPGNRTDVVTLHAELLGFEVLGDVHLVTVEFSGLIRESDQHGAAPFRELWMLARPTHGGADWKLARQQALL